MRLEGTVHGILGVAVISHPTLVNAIYHFPSATRDMFENEFNILDKFSNALCK